MARRTTTTKAPVEEEAAPAAPSAAIKPRRTRRRRTVDFATQNATLISTLLTARGERGATQGEIESVVLWGRRVHVEAAELASLDSRPRVRKAEVSPERQAAADLNSALLEGVLAGQVGIDVNEEGSLVFIRR